MPARCLLPILALTLALAAGCGLKQSAPQRQYLMLLPPVQGCPAAPSRQGVVAVRDFSASPGFTGREFVYRLGENEWQSDYYRQFLSPPAQLLAQAARATLTRSGPYAVVLTPGVDAVAEVILDGQLTALYADFRKGQGEAVAAAQFFLLRATPQGGVPLFQKAYEARIPLATRDFDGLSAAWNQALARILCDLNADLTALPRP